MLGAVGECSEPQAAAGECGADSLLGQATVAIGAGPDPYWIEGGRVYLTGPYGGGPFGLAIVVPAVAGPLDLGELVVRAAIDVAPASSALTIVAGSLPQILDGIPLQLRTIDLTVDRSGFMFDPTNCEPLSVRGTVAGSEGASAQLSTASRPPAARACRSSRSSRPRRRATAASRATAHHSTSRSPPPPRAQTPTTPKRT